MNNALSLVFSQPLLYIDESIKNIQSITRRIITKKSWLNVRPSTIEIYWLRAKDENKKMLVVPKMKKLTIT